MSIHTSQPMYTHVQPMSITIYKPKKHAHGHPYPKAFPQPTLSWSIIESKFGLHMWGLAIIIRLSKVIRVNSYQFFYSIYFPSNPPLTSSQPQSLSLSRTWRILKNSSVASRMITIFLRWSSVCLWWFYTLTHQRHRLSLIQMEVGRWMEEGFIPVSFTQVLTCGFIHFRCWCFCSH